ARRARPPHQGRLRSPPHPEPRSGDGGLVNGSRALHDRKPRNVAAAFAVAPLGGGALVAPIALVGALFGQVTPEEVFILPILFSIHGYIAAVVFGIPSYLVFRRLGWIKRIHWVLLCAGIGGINGAVWPVVALLIQLETDYPVATIGGFTVAGVLVGIVSGLVFAKVIKTEGPRADEIATPFD